MQIPLPYPDYRRCVCCLSNKHLLEQPAKTLELLIALVCPNAGSLQKAGTARETKCDRHNPNVIAWTGYPLSLSYYQWCTLEEISGRMEMGWIDPGLCIRDYWQRTCQLIGGIGSPIPMAAAPRPLVADLIQVHYESRNYLLLLDPLHYGRWWPQQSRQLSTGN